MVPLVFQVAPGKPFGRFPVAITLEPLDGLSREALPPPASDRRRKRREHFRLVLGKQLHHRLSTLGAADQQLLAHGFDAKSDFLGAMQERYSVHCASSSSMTCVRPAAPSRRSPGGPSAGVDPWVTGTRRRLPTSFLITVSRACRSAAVSAVCGSYFNVPRIQRAIVATSALRLQRATAKLSGTSTRCRFVSVNVCSLAASRRQACSFRNRSIWPGSIAAPSA